MRLGVESVHTESVSTFFRFSCPTTPSEYCYAALPFGIVRIRLSSNSRFLYPPVSHPSLLHLLQNDNIPRIPRLRNDIEPAINLPKDSTVQMLKRLHAKLLLRHDG